MIALGHRLSNQLQERRDAPEVAPRRIEFAFRPRRLRFYRDHLLRQSANNHLPPSDSHQPAVFLIPDI